MASTESVNPRFVDIAAWPTEDAVEAMLEGQLSAIAALRDQVAPLARASDAAALRLGKGGRLVYVGAGTSGRIAVQDGVELGPTFGWPQERLVFVIAGGPTALAASVEGAEDDRDDGRKQIEDHVIGAADVVIGVAASGRTPFTLGAVERARATGALTIVLANNPGSPLLEAGELSLLARTGSEIIAGSTRMKAGTAQKAALNILSTAIMLRLGRIHRGLMVDMVISNDKLLGRAHGMVRTLAGCDEPRAAEAVSLAGGDIKRAVLIAMGAEPQQAASLLQRNGRILGEAIKELGRQQR